MNIEQFVSILSLAITCFALGYAIGTTISNIKNDRSNTYK